MLPYHYCSYKIGDMKSTLWIIVLSAITICVAVAGNSSFSDAIFTRAISRKLFDQEPNKNFVWSPLSVEMALAAVMMGTDGRTFDQILQRVFRAPDRRYYMTDLMESLKQTSTMYRNEDTTLNYATILAVKDKLQLKPRYKQMLTHFYSNPALYEADFSKHGDEIAAKINDLVSKATEDRIRDLIPAGFLNSRTIMVLVNALYFNAKFGETFERKNTTKGTFQDMNGKKFQNVQFLNRKFHSLPYYEDQRIQMIKMPFEETKFNLYVAKDKNFMATPSWQQRKKNMRNLIDMVLTNVSKDQLNAKSVEVKLPKFKMEYTVEKLVENLQSLGVTDLFNSAASNFGKMLNEKNVAVSDIRHKAFIEVSEEGVEAAAATSVGLDFHMMRSEASKVDVHFHADCPFFFFITMEHAGRLNRYESTLFAGQYLTPP